MKYCNPKARVKCPYRKRCELDATFTDGSECDEFNRKCLEEKPTYADHIRAMTDVELVDFLWQFNTDSFENVIPFCKNTMECGEKLDSNDISTEMCKRCLLERIQQPYGTESGVV